LARWRGGSCGSGCHSLFFPRVLEHFVSFDFQIVKAALGLGLLRVGLELMPNFSRGRSADAQLSSQLGTRLTLTHSPDEQDRLLRGKVSSFKDGATVQIVDAFADLATVDVQLTAFRLPKPTGLLKLGPTMGTFEPFGMEVGFDPFEASFSIH
jgi:hypothetical protein